MHSACHQQQQINKNLTQNSYPNGFNLFSADNEITRPWKFHAAAWMTSYLVFTTPVGLLTDTGIKLETFCSECAHGAVDNARVWFVQSSGLYHLSLVLYQQFHTLDRRSSRL